VSILGEQTRARLALAEAELKAAYDAMQHATTILIDVQAKVAKLEEAKPVEEKPDAPA